jgi:hypothetical protein
MPEHSKSISLSSLGGEGRGEEAVFFLKFGILSFSRGAPQRASAVAAETGSLEFGAFS